ncbi:hypothetical protein BC828DRAFT_408742, partial [Blastocladiella britannica]
MSRALAPQGSASGANSQLPSGAQIAVPSAAAANATADGAVALVEAELQEDKELQAFMQLTSLEDKAITMALEHERAQTESRLAEIERVNNFYIDEAHIREVNLAEAQFLLDEQIQEKRSLISRQTQEAGDLKEEEEDKTMLDKLVLEFRALKFRVRAREEAHEKVKSMKRRTQDKRRSFGVRIKDIEARQERERRALMDSHMRVSRNMTIYRKLLFDTNPSLARIVAASQATAAAAAAAAAAAGAKATVAMAGHGEGGTTTAAV